jgi:D-alanyl-D-alanine carboxypeptidase/D-alanyl-D-alanine-endopeptidase (penicillin-binding protein 4)
MLKVSYFQARFVVCAVVCASTLLPTAQARDAQLPPVVARAMSSVGVPAASVSIHVHDANTNESIVELNPDTLRSPASVMKVVTTFAALDLLGPAYSWKTRAYATGPVSNGVLNGDLYLVGGGDPYITSERWWSFVQALRERGLERITGNVVIDNSFFAPITGSRADFDDQPFRSYNALPDALLVNFQTARFTFTPATDGSRIKAAVSPLPSNLIIKNQLKVAAGKCQGANRGVAFDTDVAQPDMLIISGAFATTCGPYSVTRAIMTAPAYAYGTFRTLWEQSGGTIDGTSRLGLLPTGATLLLESESLSLAEIIRLVNKYSNNVMARHLMLTLGAEAFGAPATEQKGRDAIRDWLQARGVRITGLTLENGSGLSRAERITARGLGQVLDLAWHSPFMPEMAASLPLSATDGTVRRRFNAAGMQGRLRLKTGTLDNVSSLAGFINAASGKTYVMVIIVNHPGAPSGSAQAIQSELVRWVFGQ